MSHYASDRGLRVSGILSLQPSTPLPLYLKDGSHAIRSPQTPTVPLSHVYLSFYSA